MLETNASAVTQPFADPVETVAAPTPTVAPGPEAPGPTSRRYRFGWIPEVILIAIVGYVYWNVGPQKGIAYAADGEPKQSVVDAVGNRYGGLPSHHASCALWSVCALWPITRRRWAKGLLITHLVLTIGAITVTGNHRWI